MKKIMAMLLAVTMAMGMASCGSEESSNDDIDSKAETSAAETSSTADEASQTESSELEADESSISDADFTDLDGYAIYLPKSFEDISVAHPISKGISSTGKEFYYTYFNNLLYNPESEPTLDDVYGYMSDGLARYIDDAYDCWAELVNNVESEEKIEINGNEYLKVIGTFQTEGLEDDVTEERYVFYYSLLEYPDMTPAYGVVPTLWGAFAADIDDQTFEEMEQLVQTTAEQLRWKH